MNEIKVIKQRVEFDHVVIEVKPFVAEIADGRKVVIDCFFAWIANHGAYPEPRGRVIKKNGDVGARQLVWWDVPVPAGIANKLIEMCAA